MNQLNFNGTELTTVKKGGAAWLSTAELAKALGYKRASSVTRIFNRYHTEFTADLVTTVTDENGYETRLFSLWGCHLVASYAKTEAAKAFCGWLLKLLAKSAKAPEVVAEKAEETAENPAEIAAEKPAESAKAPEIKAEKTPAAEPETAETPAETPADPPPPAKDDGESAPPAIENTEPPAIEITEPPAPWVEIEKPPLMPKNPPTTLLTPENQKLIPNHTHGRENAVSIEFEGRSCPVPKIREKRRIVPKKPRLSGNRLRTPCRKQQIERRKAGIVTAKQAKAMAILYERRGHLPIQRRGVKAEPRPRARSRPNGIAVQLTPEPADPIPPQDASPIVLKVLPDRSEPPPPLERPIPSTYWRKIMSQYYPIDDTIEDPELQYEIDRAFENALREKDYETLGTFCDEFTPEDEGTDIPFDADEIYAPYDPRETEREIIQNHRNERRLQEHLRKRMIVGMYGKTQFPLELETFIGVSEKLSKAGANWAETFKTLRQRG